MSHILFNITAGVYLAATLVYIAFLVSHNKRLGNAARYVLFSGFAAHTLTIAARWFEAGRIPAASLHESLTLYAWLTVCIYAVLYYRYRVAVLGAFVSPFALILLITASLLPSEIVPLAPALESLWLPVHVTLAFLGNAFFALAFLFGLMYIIQEHYLKSRKVGGLYFVLPSLEVLDELNYKCLQYGFSLLTLGMITGAMWSEYATGSWWMWKPRQTLSIITWFLYAALLHGRFTTAWRGRKAALWSGAAFMVLIGSYIIVNVVMGAGHGIVK